MLSITISEGMKKLPLEEMQEEGSERTRFSWVPRAQQMWAACLCGHEALRDAAKVKETQGDLPSNSWPHKFLY